MTKTILVTSDLCQNQLLLILWPNLHQTWQTLRSFPTVYKLFAKYLQMWEEYKTKMHLKSEQCPKIPITDFNSLWKKFATSNWFVFYLHCCILEKYKFWYLCFRICIFCTNFGICVFVFVFFCIGSDCKCIVHLLEMTWKMPIKLTAMPITKLTSN